MIGHPAHEADHFCVRLAEVALLLGHSSLIFYRHMDRRSWQKDHRTTPRASRTPHPHSELANLLVNVTEVRWRQSRKSSPTTCCIITLIVRRGMSPQGTLFVARARHSFGGTDCKKCSMAGKSSTGSSLSSFKSCGMFLANFQTHFNTNSATFDSCESGKVPCAGKGLTI